MPLKQCQINGVSGWQFGNKGRCYAGAGGKRKAIKQALAEGGGKLPPDFHEQASAEDLELYDEIMLEGPDRWAHAVEMLESTYGYVSEEQRKKMPLSDFADPENRGFPCHDKAHWEAARRLVGRAPKAKQAAIKKRIEEIGKRKGWATEDKK